MVNVNQGKGIYKKTSTKNGAFAELENKKEENVSMFRKTITNSEDCSFRIEQADRNA